MSKDEHEDEAEERYMSLREVTLMLRRHDKDLYRGNGRPGITQRLATLEDYMDRTDVDLYNAEHGVVPQLTKFFAVLGERERQASNKMTMYLVYLSAVAVGAPICWDLLKHAFGWLPR